MDEQRVELLAGEPTEHVHVAFPARDNATVDAFHRAAVEAGYRDNGAPGERPTYHATWSASCTILAQTLVIILTS